MNRAATRLALVAGVVLSTRLFAQSPPNFAGTWRLPAGPNAQPGDPVVLTITQAANVVEEDTITMTLKGSQVIR